MIFFGRKKQPQVVGQQPDADGWVGLGSSAARGMKHLVDRVAEHPDGTTIYLDAGFRLRPPTLEERMERHPELLAKVAEVVTEVRSE